MGSERSPAACDVEFPNVTVQYDKTSVEALPCCVRSNRRRAVCDCIM